MPRRAPRWRRLAGAFAPPAATRPVASSHAPAPASTTTIGPAMTRARTTRDTALSADSSELPAITVQEPSVRWTDVASTRKRSPPRVTLVNCGSDRARRCSDSETSGRFPASSDAAAIWLAGSSTCVSSSSDWKSRLRPPSCRSAPPVAFRTTSSKVAARVRRDESNEVSRPFASDRTNAYPPTLTSTAVASAKSSARRRRMGTTSPWCAGGSRPLERSRCGPARTACRPSGEGTRCTARPRSRARCRRSPIRDRGSVCG